MSRLPNKRVQLANNRVQPEKSVIGINTDWPHPSSVYNATTVMWSMLRAANKLTEHARKISDLPYNPTFTYTDNINPYRTKAKRYALCVCLPDLSPFPSQGEFRRFDSDDSLEIFDFMQLHLIHSRQHRTFILDCQQRTLQEVLTIDHEGYSHKDIDAKYPTGGILLSS